MKEGNVKPTKTERLFWITNLLLGIGALASFSYFYIDGTEDKLMIIYGLTFGMWLTLESIVYAICTRSSKKHSLISILMIVSFGIYLGMCAAGIYLWIDKDWDTLYIVFPILIGLLSLLKFGSFNQQINKEKRVENDVMA